MDSVEFDLDEKRVHGLSTLPPLSGDTVHVDEVSGAQLIKNTDAQKSKISTLTSASPLEREITKISNEDIQKNITDLENIQEEAENTRTFPFLAWEAVKVGMMKENSIQKKIQKHIDEVDLLQKNIDLLLDLNGKLGSMKEEKNPMTEELKSILDQLKEKGVDLGLSEEKELSKEQISELKSLSNGQIDKIRSNIQITLSTKVQPLINEINSIIEILKEIIKSNDAICRYAIQKAVS